MAATGWLLSTPLRACSLGQDANETPTGLDVLNALLDLVDEFGAQFATDPPCQPTLARAAG